MNNSENYAQSLKRKNKLLTVMLIISLSTLAYVIYLVQRNTGGQKFLDPIDEAVAINNVDKVRRWPRSTGNSSKGVWYDTADIKKYIDSTYPLIIKRLTKDGSGTPPQGYEWKLGFYWMMTADKFDGKTKRDFCVMPILVSKLKGDNKYQSIDYFDDKTIYRHTSPEELRAGNGNAYDNGQMWP